MAQVWTITGTTRRAPRWALKDGDKTPGASLPAGSCPSGQRLAGGLRGGVCSSALFLHPLLDHTPPESQDRVLSRLTRSVPKPGGRGLVPGNHSHTSAGQISSSKGFGFQQEGPQAEGSQRQTRSVHLRERDLRPSPWPAPSAAWAQEQARAPFTGVTDAGRRQSRVVWPVLV